MAATESRSMTQLIACRAAMGIGAAFIMPSTLSILVNVFSPEERTKAIAIRASVTGAAGAIGPVASGWLLGRFWYGSVFLVNVPILVLALVTGGLMVTRSKDPKQGRLDPVGAMLSVIGIVAIAFGLIEAPESGWASARTIISFLVGVAVLTAFVFWELRCDEPMLDIRYFRSPAFSTGAGGMILVLMALYGVLFSTCATTRCPSSRRRAKRSATSPTPRSAHPRHPGVERQDPRRRRVPRDHHRHNHSVPAVLKNALDSVFITFAFRNRRSRTLATAPVRSPPPGRSSTSPTSPSKAKVSPSATPRSSAR